jgi:hypothetical protein
MPNLSLARIMYGTNEDIRAAGWMSTSAVSSPSSSSGAEAASGRAGSGHLSLGAYLHKAWVALTARH